MPVGGVAWLSIGDAKGGAGKEPGVPEEALTQISDFCYRASMHRTPHRELY